MADPRYVTIAELREIVLPLAAKIGDLERRLAEREAAETDAKIPKTSKTRRRST